MDNRPPIEEKRPSLEELVNKHLEESTRRRTEMEEWLTKEFHTKAANEINSPSLYQCKAVYADKKTSLDNGRQEISIASNKCTQIVQTNNVSPKILPCQLPLKELNPGNFTLPCTIGSLNFYAMADLGASVNVIPKSIFEHLKLARLKKTDMLVEMADMTKRSPTKIVKNVLVKIDKFLFLLDFMVMNMLYTCNETMILGRPFLATIHAEIDVLNKEISLGTGGELKFWPTCDPNIKECNGGHEMYEMNKEGDLKKWYCYYDDDRKKINGVGLSFPEFLLVKYGENQEKGLIWDEKFEEWCINNPNTPTSRKVQGDNTYWWHHQKSEEEERRKLGINIEEYEPPMVHVETFEVKRYLFDIGQSFIYVTKELMDALPMGRENESSLSTLFISSRGIFQGPSEHFSKRQEIWTWNALKWRVQGSLRRNIPEGLRRNILQRRNESSHPLRRKASPTLRRNIQIYKR
ncbi:reverse transcriptase domain-containing protein [Tanacetum coccineum]